MLLFVFLAIVGVTFGAEQDVFDPCNSKPCSTGQFCISRSIKNTHFVCIDENILRNLVFEMQVKDAGSLFNGNSANLGVTTSQRNPQQMPQRNQPVQQQRVPEQMQQQSLDEQMFVEQSPVAQQLPQQQMRQQQRLPEQVQQQQQQQQRLPEHMQQPLDEQMFGEQVVQQLPLEQKQRQPLNTNVQSVQANLQPRILKEQLPQQNVQQQVLQSQPQRRLRLSQHQNVHQQSQQQMRLGHESVEETLSFEKQQPMQQQKIRVSQQQQQVPQQQQQQQQVPQQHQQAMLSTNSRTVLSNTNSGSVRQGSALKVKTNLKQSKTLNVTTTLPTRVVQPIRVVNTPVHAPLHTVLNTHVQHPSNKLRFVSFDEAPTPTFSTKEICDGLQSGDTLAHPFDNSKFIICNPPSNGQIMSCPPSLKFNPFKLRCDYNDNEPQLACLSNPCKNSGICKDMPNYTYKCECQDGFEGDRCEKGADPCSGNPCGPNGVCGTFGFQTQALQHYCLCDNNQRYGLDCESNTYPNPCLNLDHQPYYAAKFNRAVFIHCEAQTINLKACNPPLVWEDSIQACDRPF